MPSTPRFKTSLSATEGAFYEFLWAYYLKHKAWPSTWEVYRTHLEKPKLTKALAAARHVLHVENTSVHPRTFELPAIGILATGRATTYRKWLLALLEYLRDRFYGGGDSQTVIAQAEVQNALKFSAQEADELGQMIRGGFLSMNPVWQANHLGWQLFLPCNLLEDFPRNGSLKRELDVALNRLLSHSKRRRGNRIPPLALGVSSLSEMAFADRSDGVRRYQVFVSSPFVDLKDERRLVVQALLEIGCFPAGMELFPAASMEQWKLIKNVISESDFYVVFTAAKYGTLIPGTTTSYTEREFEHARRIGKPILAFYHSEPGKIIGDKTERTLVGKRRLAKFVEKLQTNRMCRSWGNAHELADAVKSSLRQAFSSHAAPGWIRAS